jgi:hypothetical protein
MKLKTALAPIVALVAVAFVASDATAYYAPPLGRWITRDPIGYEGSKWNLYEYATSNPIHKRDPQGLACGCENYPVWHMDDGSLYEEAEDRRKGGGPKDDSSHHCWGICMVGALNTPFLADYTRRVRDFYETDDVEGDKDRAAHQRGVECAWAASWAAVNPFSDKCPEEVCDECCGSKKLHD